MTDQTTEGRVAKARERAERPCVWSEGEVPRHVAEYLWDAVHDRHALLAYIDTLAADHEGVTFTVDSLAVALESIEGMLGTKSLRQIAAAIIQVAKEASE